MQKINNVEELKTLEMRHVWAWSHWEGYSVWQWQPDANGGGGLCEMAPTDMADFRRDEKITDEMFPMYVIPEPPAKPETIDALQGFTQAFNSQVAASPTVIDPEPPGPEWKQLGYVTEDK